MRTTSYFNFTWIFVLLWWFINPISTYALFSQNESELEISFYDHKQVSYNFEKQEFQCRALPRFRVEPNASEKDKERLRTLQSDFVFIPMEKCQDQLLKNTFFKKVKDRGGVCMSVFNSLYGEIPMEEVKKENCHGTDELNSLSIETATQKFYDFNLKQICQNLKNCFGVLEENNREGLKDITDILSKMLGAPHQPASLNETEQIKQARERLTNLKQTLSTCQDQLPEVDALLSNDLSYLAKTLERDISVFHWFSSSKAFMIESSHKSPESIKSRLYADYMQGLFYDQTFTGDLVGPGLYAATDPNRTSDYGDKLLKIDLEKGTKYLDLRNSEHGFTVSEATKNALEEKGCDGFRYHLQDMEFEKERAAQPLYVGIKNTLYTNKVCREIFNRVIKKEGYQFLSYSYNSQPPRFCDKDKRQIGDHSAAFVLFDVPLTSENIDLYDNNFEDREGVLGPSESEVEKYKRLSHIYLRYNFRQNPNTSERKEYELLWRKRIFNCDDSFNDEPVMRPKPEEPYEIPPV